MTYYNVYQLDDNDPYAMWEVKKNIPSHDAAQEAAQYHYTLYGVDCVLAEVTDGVIVKTEIIDYPLAQTS